MLLQGGCNAGLKSTILKICSSPQLSDIRAEIHMRHVVRPICVLLGLILSSVFSKPALSQGAEATLVGTISDSTGAILAGVTVTATNTATGRTRSSLSDDSGNYIMASLAASSYVVTAELPGFRRTVMQGIVLQVGQEARLN